MKDGFASMEVVWTSVDFASVECSHHFPYCVALGWYWTWIPQWALPIWHLAPAHKVLKKKRNSQEPLNAHQSPWFQEPRNRCTCTEAKQSSMEVNHIPIFNQLSRKQAYFYERWICSHQRCVNFLPWNSPPMSLLRCSRFLPGPGSWPFSFGTILTPTKCRNIWEIRCSHLRHTSHAGPKNDASKCTCMEANSLPWEWNTFAWK